MTALPASVFSGTTRYLRVWFSSDECHLRPPRAGPAHRGRAYALQATNADYLDGQDSAAFRAPIAMTTRTVNVTGDSMSGTLTVDTSSGHGISARTTSVASTVAAVDASNGGDGLGLKAVSVNSNGIYAESAYAVAIYALGDRSDAVWAAPRPRRTAMRA